MACPSTPPSKQLGDCRWKPLAFHLGALTVWTTNPSAAKGAASKGKQMLRTILEHHENGTNWEPAYPLWFGEPTDPFFAFDDEENLAQVLKDSGITVVTDRTIEYKEDELSADGSADWYYAEVQQLLDSPVIKGRFALEMMLRCVKEMSEQNGCEPNHLRVVFYRPLLFDIR